MDDQSVQRVYNDCMGHARRICPGDPAIDAEDVLQAAWVKAGAHLAGLPSDLDRVRFLMRAVTQVGIDHHRRAARRIVAIPLEDWHPDRERFEDAALNRMELAPYFVLAASDPHLAAVMLLALGYDQREAAERMHCKRSTVGTRVYRWHQARTEAQA